MGTIVPVLRYDDYTMLNAYDVMDTNNVVWRMSLDNASWQFGAPGGASMAFTSGNCTGTPYFISFPPPRFAFRYITSAGQWSTDAYAIPDNVVPTFTAIQSRWQNAQCNPAPAQMAIPVSSAKQVTAPMAPPGVPPYHPEFL